MKTIREILLGGLESFPKDEEQRKEVENVVERIRYYVKNNKYNIWGREIPKAGDVFGIEIIPDLFNGTEVPEGERIFYLLRTPNDESYYDYFKELPLNINQSVCEYTFDKSQDRYFEYLMAREGIIRRVCEGKMFPSEVRWYLI